MNVSRSETLDQALLGLFIRAVTEGQDDVAEHLLLALEAVAATCAETSGSLDAAYAGVALRAGDADDNKGPCH